MAATEQKNANIGKGLLLFLLLLGATGLILLRDQNLGGIWAAMQAAAPIFLLLGLACGLMFILGEALNIRTLLRFLGNEVSFPAAIRYAFTGFFFSSITPSASGGQPMQVYAMKKDGIDISHSSLALLLELISFQLVVTVLGILSFFYVQQTVAIAPMVKYFVAFGVGLNTLLLMLMLLVIGSQKFVTLLCRFLQWFFRHLPFLSADKRDRWNQGVVTQIAEFRRCSAMLQGNKRVMFKVIPVTLLQVAFLFSIPYVVYRAFGLDTSSFLTLFSLQAVLFVASSLIPMPGAVGVSEGGFLILFQSIYPAALMGPAMFLSRGISFYLLLAISGLSLAAYRLWRYFRTKTVKERVKETYAAVKVNPFPKAPEKV